MTGDKPDERLRTPMQWTGSSAGFTSGKPWETAQPDSLAVNVASQDRAPNSLLNLYRQLTRLRAANPALRNGELVPVETGNESVLAYIRKDGSRQVLVVANLGKTPAAPFSLPGRYTLRSLVGGAETRTTIPPLAARRAYIYQMSQRP
jgi:glycosidase